MDSQTLKALSRILRLLGESNLRGLFLITSGAWEAIRKDLKIVESLDRHEIGFHSSSHSVKPRILEYTDLQGYDEAVRISALRESSRINLFSGRMAERGGIVSLREDLPNKKIDSFRAPFDCFSPPHAEGLRQLGFRFIFSGDFSSEPVCHKGLTLYPEASFIDDPISKIFRLDYSEKTFRSPIFSSFAGGETLVFAMHPSRMVYEEARDVKSHFRDPMRPTRVRANNAFSGIFNQTVFRCFLAILNRLQKEGLIEVTPTPEVPRKQLDPKKASVEKNVERCSDVAMRLFGYKPKFLRAHYDHFLSRETSA